MSGASAPIALRTAATPPLLSLRGVGRRYGRGDLAVEALRDVDLDIRAGELLAIVGPSGSGKSTLLQLLGGLDRPTSGCYRVDGVDTATLDADGLAVLRSRVFGFVFQRYHLLPDLSAMENVAMPAQYGPPRSSVQRRQRAMSLLCALGLEDRMDRRPAQLSGGQQQRVGIARAMMNGARVLIADEPTGALDARTGQALLDQLKALHRQGQTLVLVTHDPAVAAQADRVVELRDGRIVADRRPTPRAVPAPVGEPDGVAGKPEHRRPRAGLVEALRVGVRSLLRRPLQTGLTMSGVAIGIAAVSLVTAFGDGARDKVLADIRALGADTVEVRAAPPGSGARIAGRLGLRELELLRALPFVDGASPVVSGNAPLSAGAATVTASIEGVSEDYFRTRSRRFAAGGGFQAEDVARRAASVVIDEAAARVLFPPPHQALGQVVRLGEMAAVVVGVLQPPPGLPPPPGSYQVHLPYTTALSRLTGERPFDAITVRVRRGVSIPTAERAIARALAARHDGQSFATQSVDAILRAVDRASRSLTRLVTAVAAVALAVGGIGVMNMMLVTVGERTAEIGLRMAVGARRRDIRAQFVLEATVVCLLGAAAGLVLTGLAAALLPLLLPDAPVRLSAGSIASGLACAVGVGLFFGHWPAARAAALDPATALQR